VSTQTISNLAKLYTIVGRPNVFKYGELRSATENFCCSNLLGEGGYGSVYMVCHSSYLVYTELGLCSMCELMKA
jgi:hypothetical protein